LVANPLLVYVGIDPIVMINAKDSVEILTVSFRSLP